MGLTLHFELRLDATHSARDAHDRLTRLHAFAEQLPFPMVFPIVTPESRDDPELQSLRQWVETWADATSGAWHHNRTPHMTTRPADTIGFVIDVGDECEAATVGLLPRVDASGALIDWHWYTFCKTQYASNISEAHFVQCHTTLVRLLDHAVALGFEVTVTDEGEYWETRDEQVLLDSVRHMNHIVASVAGQLQEALGSDKDVQAPIFDHPRFERIEMGPEE